MKNIYALAVLTIAALSIQAQTTEKRVPVYELFSSSTCPPCKPASEHLMPLFEIFEEDIIPVVYHMSWPGNGDPYYTAEGNYRRNLYGTNSAPSLFREGSLVSDLYTVSESSIESQINSPTPPEMSMQLRFFLDPDNQSVSIHARMEALEDITDGGQRLYVLINEHKTFNNVETNGESEFHYVFKKMLPQSTGELIIGDFMQGDTLIYDTTYTFQGNYRLPNSAQDEIDHDTEHSVEEFSDLYVVMFMQSLVDKRFYQAAIGEIVTSEEDLNRPWGSAPVGLREFKASSEFVVYPNPAHDFITAEFAESINVETASFYAVTGERVKQVAVSSNVNRVDLETQSLAPGVYLLEIQGQTERFVKRVLVD